MINIYYSGETRRFLTYDYLKILEDFVQHFKTKVIIFRPPESSRNVEICNNKKLYLSS